MFSQKQKREISQKIEEILLSYKHPEMPTEKPKFRLHVDGSEAWSWADIEPNWLFDDGHKEVGVNSFNERVEE